MCHLYMNVMFKMSYVVVSNITFYKKRQIFLMSGIFFARPRAGAEHCSDWTDRCSEHLNGIMCRCYRNGVQAT